MKQFQQAISIGITNLRSSDWSMPTACKISDVKLWQEDTLIHIKWTWIITNSCYNWSHLLATNTHHESNSLANTLAWKSLKASDAAGPTFCNKKSYISNTATKRPILTHPTLSRNGRDWDKILTSSPPMSSNKPCVWTLRAWRLFSSMQACWNGKELQIYTHIQ